MISDLKLNRKLDNLHNPPLHTAKTSSWGRRQILEHLRSPWRGQGTPFTHPTPQLSCRTRPPHSFTQIYLSSSQELKEHGYWDLQNLCKLPWGWSKGIVVHSPEQLQQKQQNLERIWILYHMQIILTSASPCKGTLCTDLIFKLTKILWAWCHLRSTLCSFPIMQHKQRGRAAAPYFNFKSAREMLK